MLLVSLQHTTSMARDTRSKLRNVVKSRSAPSLLGGFSPSRQLQEPPSNRFIELGDIALGNSRRHSSHDNIEAPKSAPEIPEIEVAPKAAKTKAPRVAKPAAAPVKTPIIAARAAKVPRLAASARPAPLTRPKPPKPPIGRPQLAMPPKSVVPKPPKVNRPKPMIGRLDSKPRTPR